jgi:hypothetical protein
MRVTTHQVFKHPPEHIWPLLGNSRMEIAPPCVFRLGVPRPLECRLSEDGTDSKTRRRTRQCISDRGTIDQRILIWEPYRRLQFEMETTDIYFKRWIIAIRECFDLQRQESGVTIVTRTTDYCVRQGWKFPCSITTWIGMKWIHRYVFQNWHHALNRTASA